MSLANKVTTLRIILVPFFFTLFLLEDMYVPSLRGQIWVMAILWVLFIIIECSDWVDGLIARRRNEVSDFGKLYDPFADTLVRLSYFLCFVYTRNLPITPLLIILFREFGILFLRILMMKKGITMGARKGGKIKAVFYMLTGLSCLLSVTMHRISFLNLYFVFRIAAFGLFFLSMIIAIVSFVDYFLVYRRARS